MIYNKTLQDLNVSFMKNPLVNKPFAGLLFFLTANFQT